MTTEEIPKPATAGAAGVLGIVSGFWCILEGLLIMIFSSGANNWAEKLLFIPFFQENPIIAGIISMICAGICIFSGALVIMRKYIEGGLIMICASMVSIVVGGGFYITVLWGASGGLIALVCPSLEEKIKEQIKIEGLP
ncbi:MAG TPA: hypothetical protein VMV49_16625 [Candidatus Deferrimicrobium sp.]|nr:hypothetical protein [Candidatus Deferrimicrobium sp.]